jgi:hypothetical protein
LNPETWYPGFKVWFQMGQVVGSYSSAHARQAALRRAAEAAAEREMQEMVGFPVHVDSP